MIRNDATSYEQKQACSNNTLCFSIITCWRRSSKSDSTQKTTPTPDVLTKKHVNFGQGLEFVKFGQGNRGLNQQHRRTSKETIRTDEGKRGKLDKTNRVRDSNFLFKHVLFDISSVAYSATRVYLEHHDYVSAEGG